jgi:chromosome segregation ATPase
MSSKDKEVFPASKGSIDLLNIDYEDVLHLYRGWRHAEGQLKDKNKEMNALKARIKQLQDSHVKFRGQIQALESVKELTISLQAQLSVLQEENKQLVKEKVKFSETASQAEILLVEAENEHAELVSTIQQKDQEISLFRGKYEELSASHKELEFLASEEQTGRLAAESRLRLCEDTLGKLQHDHKELREKYDSAVGKMSQCDKELAQAAKNLSALTNEVSTISSIREKLVAAETEREILETDITRLLRLLDQFSSQSHNANGSAFAASWVDSDKMSFIGKSAYNNPDIMGDGESDDVRNPQALLSHLRRLHPADQDPYPLSNSLEVNNIY